jgi:hypothetical protein
MSDNPLLRATGLWAKTSKNGRRYLTGRLGGLRVLILENHDRDKGEDAPTHLLMLGEAQKREQQQPAPAARSSVTMPAPNTERGYAELVPISSKADRERHIKELADQFEPDQELGF